jgi:ABC-type thiamin/hydroxymethylpyrimidine transport system permease subunit
MSGRTAGGLVLVVGGVVALVWGVNHMNDMHTKLLNALGGHDNNGPLAIGAGIVVAIIGMVLIISKPKSAA